MNKFYLPTIILFSLFAIGVNAQQASNLGLSVSPQIFELEVFQGQNLQEEIIVGNLSDVALPILVKTTDFTADDFSGEMEFDESLEDPIISSKKWFEVKTPNFILEPGERRKINFKISVPENAEPEGHYSAMLFEPQLPSYYFQPGQPKTIPVVGVLFMISVQNLSLEPENPGKPLEVAGFVIPEKEKSGNLERALASIASLISNASAADINILDESPSSFILQVKNNDIYHHKVSGKISIYNFWGKKVGETEIKTTTILPGKLREFPVALPVEIPEIFSWLPASVSNFLAKNTAFGKYSAVLNAGEEKNQIELSHKMNFWIFPWKLGFILTILVIPAILLRKRLSAAMKILLFRK